MNIRANNSCERRKSSSVNATDFALLTGLSIIPFSCSRFMASQSKPFQARHSLCSMQPEIEQREDSVIYSIFIERHEHP